MQVFLQIFLKGESINFFERGYIKTLKNHPEPLDKSPHQVDNRTIEIIRQTKRMPDTMNIAFIADDIKKELMVQFCIAYCGVLSHHNLCATATTGKMIAESTGLEVHKFLSGEHGGEQQIASRLAYNEIDLLLYFREQGNVNYRNQSATPDILSLCDMNNIPAATNVATAEILIMALARGDLDWRNIVNPKTIQENQK